MSTRSQIKMKNSEFNIHIYKHSDGYPEGVIPELSKFVEHFKKHRGLENEEPYFLAQCVRWFAISEHERNPERTRDGVYSCLGWGLDCEKHGDIQYLYEIDSNGAIYINGKKHKSEVGNE